MQPMLQRLLLPAATHSLLSGALLVRSVSGRAARQLSLPLARLPLLPVPPVLIDLAQRCLVPLLLLALLATCV